MTRLFIYLTISILLSCSNNSEEIKKLKNENLELRKRLENIKKEINDFQFSAVGIEKSNKVKLGEEYISEVGILVSKKSSPIKVELGEFVDNVFQPGDSLTETYSDCKVYRQKPNKTGTYKYGGKVELDFFDTTIVQYFQMEYSVTK
jgi:hypothetical protein